MKTVIVVDIDGTIARVGDRLKHIQKDDPDWDSFYNECSEDEPIREVIDLVKEWSKKYLILYCTGRRESTREATKQWIAKWVHGDPRILPVDKSLAMRSNGDKRHDIKVKPEILKNALDNLGLRMDNIAFVLEDRNSMVKHWREMGLVCLQVADGDF